jgi:hypothetical protein
MITLIEHKNFDEERALYGSRDLIVRNCRFDGPADGESAFKECKNITVGTSYFNLRYPFWHVDGLEIANCELTEHCRAALWYSGNVRARNTDFHGIKALRECTDVALVGCDIVSAEFGWSTRNAALQNCTAAGEYFFLRGEELTFRNVTLKGKYSFQYITDSVFWNCNFDTKDAFWHAKNVTVKNSVVKGEYLAWYSDGLTLDHCTIIGTQPLCYCKNLKLIDCEMIDCDLSFERSDVEATLTAPILSVKNPRSGTVTLPSCGEIVMDDPEARGRIVFR